MAKSGRLELGDNIYGHNRSIFNHCDVIGQQSNGIQWTTQNKSYYAVQGHSRSSKSVSIESTCDFLLIVTDILSRTVSELSQLLLFKFWTVAFVAPFGDLGKTKDVHLGLIRKRVVDFLLVLTKLFSLSSVRENVCNNSNKMLSYRRETALQGAL